MPGLQPPATLFDGVEVTDWNNQPHPKINGKNLSLLRPLEMSRSAAVGQAGIVIGTDWSLYFFDRLGHRLWTQATPRPAWAVNLSSDARLVVAAYGDGTVDWCRTSDGGKLLTFFPHNDGKRWVAWSPKGDYAASIGGEDLIGWQVNEVGDHLGYFFPASRFRDQFYHPEALRAALGAPPSTASVSATAKAEAATPPMSQAFPPVVTVITTNDQLQLKNDSIGVDFIIRSPSGEPPTLARILVNGRLLRGDLGIIRAPPLNKPIHVTIPVQAEDFQISIIAETAHAVGSPTISMVHLTQSMIESSRNRLMPNRPKLYALVVGVSDYFDESIKLGFPAKDARDFATVLQEQKGELYQDVQVHLLTNKNATRVAIIDSLNWLRGVVTRDDIAVIYLAGHGINDRNGQYLFIPYDVNTKNIPATAVNHSFIQGAMRELPGKVLAFLDTCHAGSVLGGKKTRSFMDITKFVNELASAENGVIVFASSTGIESSQESGEWGNGAFTKALKEAFSGKADLNKDGAITLNEINYWVSERVKTLTNGEQHPNMLRPDSIRDFPFTLLPTR